MSRMSLLFVPLLAACADGFKEVPTVDEGTGTPTGTSTGSTTGTGSSTGSGNGTSTGSGTSTDSGSGTGTSTGTGSGTGSGTSTGTGTGTGGTSTGTGTGTGGTSTGTGTGTGGTSTDTGSGGGTSTGSGTDTATYADCTVDVTNETGATLMRLYARDSADFSWGSDRLGVSTLSDGASFAFAVPHNQGSDYDLQAEDDLGNVYEAPAFNWCLNGETLRVTLTQDERVSGPGLDADCAVVVTNDTGLTLTRVYVRDSAESSWGMDRLGVSTLADTDSFSLDVPPNPGSHYDVQAFDTDGREYQDLAFAWCMNGESLPVTLDLDDRIPLACDLTVTNGTSQTLSYVYERTSGTVSWGADRLGAGVTLARNASVTFSVEPMASSDRYDLRGVDGDGDDYVAGAVNWCMDGEPLAYTLTDADATWSNTTRAACTLDIENATGRTLDDIHVYPDENPFATNDWWAPANVANGASVQATVPASKPVGYEIWALDTSSDSYLIENAGYCLDGETIFVTLDASVRVPT